MQALPSLVGLILVLGWSRCCVASVSSSGLTSWLVKSSWRLASRAASSSSPSLVRWSDIRVQHTIACHTHGEQS